MCESCGDPMFQKAADDPMPDPPVAETRQPLCPNDNSVFVDGACAVCGFTPVNLDDYIPVESAPRIVIGLFLATDDPKFNETAEYLGFLPVTEGHLCVGVGQNGGGKVFNLMEIMQGAPRLLKDIIQIK